MKEFLEILSALASPLVLIVEHVLQPSDPTPEEQDQAAMALARAVMDLRARRRDAANAVTPS